MVSRNRSGQRYFKAKRCPMARAVSRAAQGQRWSHLIQMVIGLRRRKTILRCQVFLQVLVQHRGARARNARALLKTSTPRRRRLLRGGPRGNLLQEALWDSALTLHVGHHHNGGKAPNVQRSRRKLQGSKGAVHRFPRNVYQYVVATTGKATNLGIAGLHPSRDLRDAYYPRQGGPYHGTPRRKLLRRKLLVLPQENLNFGPSKRYWQAV